MSASDWWAIKGSLLVLVMVGAIVPVRKGKTCIGYLLAWLAVFLLAVARINYVIVNEIPRLVALLWSAFTEELRLQAGKNSLL